MAKVYFIPAENKNDTAANSKKLGRLLTQSKILDAVSENDFTALKLHFGERKNTGYVNPEYLGAIADAVRAKKALPFLTDTNTLYKGGRTNAVEHTALALEHGFTFERCRAPIVIADGFMGENYKEVKINEKYIKTACIARAIHQAQSMVVVSHFKGHIMTGFGGAIKNIGMGCAARTGKLKQHVDVAPFVIKEKCIGCGKCVSVCPVDAIAFTSKKAVINSKKCIGCATCIAVCPVTAIEVEWGAGGDLIQEKMTEYAKAALIGKGKKCACVTFAMKITKECDCLAEDDPSICPDIGIFASTDPVSIDAACADMAIKKSGKDIFRAAHPERDGIKQLKHAAQIGIDELKYELIEIN